MSSSSLSSPPRALIPILHASHQVVLYNPTSHALTISERAVVEPKSKRKSFCPYCERPFNVNERNNDESSAANGSHSRTQSRVHNYFQLLEMANESSRPTTPTPPPDRGDADIASETMAEGYFTAFFKEEHRLGMGANGSVFLCQHVLDGNFLGRFAVKKIAVGQSHDYLLNALREVRLLEMLHHPNIVTYHHAWLETCRFSSFGPSIPTLFVLMQWAEGGSLDDFISARLGVASTSPGTLSASEDEFQSRAARIRAFRAAQAHPEQRKVKHGRAVHLLSAEEVKTIFSDVASGLGFLHSKSILHLDLKPGNVLLTWDDGRLIPRAMLSDFGTYQDMVRPQRTRTGVTGTLEYTAPESLSITNQPTSKADLWSLGMILHILLFFRLPYTHAQSSDISMLEDEVRRYPGFKPTTEVIAACKRRGLPRAAMILLEELLTIVPRTRPSCEQILAVLREGKLDPLKREHADDDRVSLVPVQRPHNGSAPSPVVTTDDDGSSTTSVGSPLTEKSPLLTLPAPPPSLLVRVAVWIISVKQWMITSHSLRVLKSAFLVMKVMSVTHVCEGTSPLPAILSLVLILAVIDTWTESVVGSICLGVVHLGVVRIGKGYCCMR